MQTHKQNESAYLENALARLIQNPDSIEEIPLTSVPTLLMHLASLQSVLTVRLLNSDRKTNEKVEGSRKDQLITVKEAAKRLSLKPAYLYSQIRDGKFPHITCGRYKRIRESDISIWIDQNRNEAVCDSKRKNTHRGSVHRIQSPRKAKTSDAWTERIRGPRNRPEKAEQASLQ